MFGESESESPRVPSPWDSLISSPPSPSSRSTHTPSPLAVELIPRLVPEADDGNVEYKLQLLSPSPARFARLVTQMKWRLLEGGGQAYYELGVADSGDLVGLPRSDLEHSLETLEMMAGEIGASVIVVKEIEVPAAMAELAASNADWADGNSKRKRKPERLTPGSFGDSTSTAHTTETETDSTDDWSATATAIVTRNASTQSLQEEYDRSSHNTALFLMDPEPDPAENGDVETDDEPVTRRFTVDLEIASVFKPRPFRTRAHNHTHQLGQGKKQRVKKPKHLTHFSSSMSPPSTVVHEGPHKDKAQYRRQARERKKEEKRKALLTYATQGIEGVADSRDLTSAAVVSTDVVANDLISDLESLHVFLDDAVLVPVATSSTVTITAAELDIPMVEVVVPDDDPGDDDVFPSPSAGSLLPTFDSSTTGETHLNVGFVPDTGAVSLGQTRYIVEALVVRKMSLEEAFLDFEGFSLT